MYNFFIHFHIKLYCNFFVTYKILITALLLGGPLFCDGELRSNYLFREFDQETINITVCGVPAPTVQWKFITGIFQNALREKVNNYTFTYSILLPKLTQDKCGKELTFIAEGYLGKQERKSRILLTNCKFIDFLVFVLVQYFFGK